MPMQRLLEIMARLRDPERGCAWDLRQDFATIAPYTIEEAYEVEEAIHRGDMLELRDELGDLLLQVVFHARMAEEAGHFGFGDVVDAITGKLIRRHPHVFGGCGSCESGDAADPRTEAARAGVWEAIKADERFAKGQGDDPFAGVPAALPALMRSAKLQERAVRAGHEGLLPHLSETGHPPLDEVALGDQLQALVRRATLAKLDPEAALREANRRLEAAVRRAAGAEEGADR